MRSSFRLRWTGNCAAGEFIGIAGAAALAVAGNRLIGEPLTLGQKALVMGIALLSGGFEGSVLSWFQWRVLREALPGLPFRHWWRNTVAVAVAGWFLGMLPSLFLAGADPVSAGEPVEPPLAVVLLAAAAMGLVLGALFGGGQWLVLRHHAARAGRWIGLNALGWMAGMVFIFLAATLPDATTTPAWIIAGGMLGGALAGLSVGVATGWFFSEKPTHRSAGRE